jgi:HEPN domain
MSQRELDRLVAEGEIARVAADPETARVELEQARLHLESAAAIAERDPVAAFALGYDAIRKALSAHMRSRGYRVTRGKGHHARIGRYAIAAIDDPRIGEHLEAFEELRQLRNQSEYDAVVVRSEDVSEVLARADAIINVVDESL